MNRNNENGLGGAAIAEAPVQEPVPSANLTLAATANGNQPYVPQTDKKHPALKENAGVLLAGAGIVIALVLIVFGHIPHHPSATSNRSLLNNRQQATRSAESTGSGTSSILPINDAAHPQEVGTQQSSVGPDEIGRTAKQRQQPAASNLGGIPPFNNQASWDAGPYQPGVEPTPLADITETTESKNEWEAMEKPSLVFVKSAQASSARTQESPAALDLGIGLLPGTRLRARLESAVNTAVQTPVVAVVEYNYEQNGEIIVPAGAKVFGHLEAADRSGYIGVRFDSMMTPDGASVSMEGAATDLQLRPLRGRVEAFELGQEPLMLLPRTLNRGLRRKRRQAEIDRLLLTFAGIVTAFDLFAPGFEARGIKDADGFPTLRVPAWRPGKPILLASWCRNFRTRWTLSNGMSSPIARSSTALASR
jgi:hypothetical protein